MKTNKQRGSILLIFLITLPFLILIALYYSHLALVSFQVARLDQLHSSAQLSADAGADYAIEKISLDNTWAGTGGEINLHNGSRTRTTFDVTVINGTNKKTLAVVGRSYSPVNSTTAQRSVTIYVDLRPISSGNYGVISGEGGLFMTNSAKIVGGAVFINGEIQMSNTSQIGLSTNPVSVKVADQICPNPPDSTYPRVCNAGENGQPITINNTAHIYGTVTATNQTSGAGMSNSGLVAGTVAPQPLPTYNRAAQIAAVTSTITGAAASCTGSQSIIWPANLKITGDVNISGKCNVLVQGNVWITGSFSMNNTSVLKVDDALGSTVPNIMVDGASGATFQQSSTLASNTTGTGFEIYTFYSTAACSPDCTSLSGADLYNSRSITTISLQNTASAPTTVFYAYWSQVSVANSGALGAIIGQTILMSNTGTLTFGAPAATGGPTVYVVEGYRRH